MTSAPPVPPQSYWPDQGTQRPDSPKAPGWAKGILIGAAVVAVLGGGLIGVRNLGTETPPIAQPTFEPKLPEPTFAASESATESQSAEPEESSTPEPSSTFPALKAVPEVCDLLPDSLTKRLAPKSVSEVDVARDGYGALRKGCDWHMSDRNIGPGNYNLYRAIYVKVNVWPSVGDAREDAASRFDSMGDLAGTKEENPGLKYLSTYGELKDLQGLGDEAHAIYTWNLKGTTNVWLYAVMGNATIDIRYHGTDNKAGEINAEGENTRPVPEGVLMKGSEEIAAEVIKNLQGS